MSDLISIAATKRVAIKWARGERGHIREDTLLALVDAVEAAQPMARLPYPLSSDERVDWMTHQQRLVDALARFDFGERA